MNFYSFLNNATAFSNVRSNRILDVPSTRTVLKLALRELIGHIHRAACLIMLGTTHQSGRGSSPVLQALAPLKSHLWDTNRLISSLLRLLVIPSPSWVARGTFSNGILLSGRPLRRRQRWSPRATGCKDEARYDRQ